MKILLAIILFAAPTFAQVPPLPKAAVAVAQSPKGAEQFPVKAAKSVSAAAVVVLPPVYTNSMSVVVMPAAQPVYVFQRTTDFTNWQDVFMCLPQKVPTNFTDTTAPPVFYRAVVAPASTVNNPQQGGQP